jgi:hypothetical protein
MMNVFALHFNFKYSYACRANQDEPVRAEANAYRERR